jgi:hypothetical protein
MSRFLAVAQRKLKGRERSPQSSASTSVASLVLPLNSNNPQGDLYSTVGDIGIKVVSDPVQAELEYALDMASCYELRLIVEKA